MIFLKKFDFISKYFDFNLKNFYIPWFCKLFDLFWSTPFTLISLETLVLFAKNFPISKFSIRPKFYLFFFDPVILAHSQTVTILSKKKNLEPLSLSRLISIWYFLHHMITSRFSISLKIPIMFHFPYILQSFFVLKNLLILFWLFSLHKSPSGTKFLYLTLSWQSLFLKNNFTLEANRTNVTSQIHKSNRIRAIEIFFYANLPWKIINNIILSFIFLRHR